MPDLITWPLPLASALVLAADVYYGCPPRVDEYGKIIESNIPLNAAVFVLRALRPAQADPNRSTVISIFSGFIPLGIYLWWYEDILRRVEVDDNSSHDSFWGRRIIPQEFRLAILFAVCSLQLFLGHMWLRTSQDQNPMLYTILAGSAILGATVVASFMDMFIKVNSP